MTVGVEYRRETNTFVFTHPITQADRDVFWRHVGEYHRKHPEEYERFKGQMRKVAELWVNLYLRVSARQGESKRT